MDAEVIELSPEASALAEQAELMMTQATEYSIATAEDYELGAEELKHIKAKGKELDEQRRSMTRPLDETKKKIMDLFRQPLSFCEKAEKSIKAAMIGYQNEQKRIQREEEDRQRAVAEKERKRLERQAKNAEKRGDEEKAEEIRDRADEVLTPIVPIQTPAVKGISTRTTWSAEVVDKGALIQAVVSGKVSHLALDPNMKFLNGQARSMEKELDYPGVKAVPTEGIASRAS